MVSTKTRKAIFGCYRAVCTGNAQPYRFSFLRHYQYAGYQKGPNGIGISAGYGDQWTWVLLWWLLRWYIRPNLDGGLVMPRQLILKIKLLLEAALLAPTTRAVFEYQQRDRA